MHNDIVYEEITFEQFSPVLLLCSFYNDGRYKPLGFRLGERYVYDYEIELFTFSAGGMMVENRDYPVRKGDIVFRKPGQLVEGIMPYSCYLICFDLKGNTGKSPSGYRLNNQRSFQRHYRNTFLDTIPPVFHPSSEEVYLHLFESLLQEYINPGENSSLVTKAGLLKLLNEIYKDNRGSYLIKNGVPSSPHYLKLKKSIDYIIENYHKKINLSELSEVTELSSTYFHKIFTETLGVTPRDYIAKIRIDKAREMLARTDLPVYEIALSCGFDNIPYFSYVFKQYCKVSPMEFRKQYNYI